MRDNRYGMSDRADFWPSLSSDKTLTEFRGTKTSSTLDLGLDSSTLDTLRGRDALLDALLHHIDAVDRERDELGQETRWMNVRIRALEQSLQKAADVDAARERQAIMERVEDLAADLTEQLDAISKTTDTSHSDIHDLSNALAAAERVAGEADRRVAGLAAELDQRRMAEDQLSSSIATVSDEVVAQRQQVDAASSRLDELDDFTAGARAAVLRIRNTTRLIEELVSETEGRLAAQISEVASGVDAGSSRAAETDRRLADVVDELSGLVARIEAGESNVLSVADRVSTVGDEVAQVRGRVGEVGELATTANSAAQNAGAHSREIEERLETEVVGVAKSVFQVSSSLDTVAANVASVSSAVTDADRLIAWLMAELSNAKEVADRQIGALEAELNAVIVLVREAQATADTANNLAEHSFSVSNGLRTDFDAEIDRAIAEEAQTRENRIRLAAALDTLDDRSELVEVDVERSELNHEDDLPDEPSDSNDRHRLRWDEHLQVQSKLRRQRSEKR